MTKCLHLPIRGGKRDALGKNSGPGTRVTGGDHMDPETSWARDLREVVPVFLSVLVCKWKEKHSQINFKASPLLELTLNGAYI